MATVVAGCVVGRRASGDEEEQQDGGDRGQEQLAAAEDRHGPSRRSWGGRQGRFFDSDGRKKRKEFGLDLRFERWDQNPTSRRPR